MAQGHGSDRQARGGGSSGRGGEPLDPNTQDLVRRARASGDPSTFGALFSRVAPGLAAWARLRVRPSLRARLDPDDLAQEVCLRAYRAFDRFDPERGSFRAWLMGIAQRVLQEALADLARGRSGSQDVEGRTRALEALPADATAVSRRVARDETLERLIERLEQLAAADHALLLHRGLEGRPHGEVADLLGVDVETARKRWQRLLARLRTDPGLVALALDEA
ncbi:MAG: sigma-70 family RNA polymerase sigma factor [Planctomycetota bacterium]